MPGGRDSAQVKRSRTDCLSGTSSPPVQDGVSVASSAPRRKRAASIACIAGSRDWMAAASSVPFGRIDLEIVRQVEDVDDERPIEAR